MEADTAQRVLIGLVAEHSGVDQESIFRDSRFEELGMDSLDFACLIQAARVEVGPLPDLKASQMETVGDLIDHFST